LFNIVLAREIIQGEEIKAIQIKKEVVKTAKKHMKKCSPSLAINEMQIKTTLRFHLIPVRIATIKNTTNNK
jgi:hypothetical protein